VQVDPLVDAWNRRDLARRVEPELSYPVTSRLPGITSRVRKSTEASGSYAAG